MLQRRTTPTPNCAWIAVLAILTGLCLVAPSHADSNDPVRLGFVDVLSGPDGAEGQARLADLEEAVRRFELFNEGAKVQILEVDLVKDQPHHHLHQLDAAVFGEASRLDDWIDTGIVYVADSLVRDGASDSVPALLDTATAFLAGSAGVAITSGDPSSVDALRFTPPEIAYLIPPRVFPGEMTTVYLDYLGNFLEGEVAAEVGSAGGVVNGPYVDLDSFVIQGFNVAVPLDAETGPVRLSIPSAGTPAVNREVESVQLLVIEEEPAPPPPPPPPPPPTPTSCDNVSFWRLGSPNFFPEIADSKDVVVGQFDTDDNVLDVFVPQTFSHTETLYKGLGNDAAGLPQFATIVNILTNDTASKRQYGATAGDIDGDGDLDVVPSGSTVQGASERVRLLYNNNNLSFTNLGTSRVTNYAAVSGSNHSWDETALADVDGDGDLDIALANRDGGGNGRSALLLNLGSFPGDPQEGTFTAYPGIFNEPIGDSHHDVFFCDIDKDGYPDLLQSQNWQGPDGPVRLFINQHDGDPAADVPPSFVNATGQMSGNGNATHEHVACHDFDNNGWVDVHAGVWNSGSGDTDKIFLNFTTDSNGNGNIEISEIVLTAVADPDPTSPAGTGFKANVYSAHYGDFNNDTFLDIVVGANNFSNKGPFLMCNNGDGTFTRVGPLGQFWHDLTNTAYDHFNTTSPDVGDFNGDGLLDLVFGMGDGMNGLTLEANRIYVQESGSGGGGGGGGGGTRCKQLFSEALVEPCLEVEASAEGMLLSDASQRQITPLSDFCGKAFDCPRCGGPFLACEQSYNLVFDFAAVGLDPKIAEIAIIDFAGEPVAADVKDKDGQKLVSFVPEGEFKSAGLDQELLIEIRLTEGSGAGAIVPVSLTVTDGPPGK